MSRYKKVKIISNVKENENVYRMDVHFDENIRIMPGQFFMIKMFSEYSFDPILSRPFSVGMYENNVLSFYYRIVGKGTNLMKTKREGDTIEIMGPLGNGFTLDSALPVSVIGGGMGVAPLLYLVKMLDKKGVEFSFIAGFKSKDDIFASGIIEKYGKIILEEKEGVVTEHIPSDRDYFMIACGPVGMYRSLKRKFPGKNIEVSLEERMGCGYGVCKGCSVPAKKGGYFKVCTDGPVFNILELGEI